MNGTVIECLEEIGTYQYAFAVEVEGVMCVGALTLQQPSLGFNDTELLVGTVVNGTYPSEMFAPESCFEYPEGGKTEKAFMDRVYMN